MLLHFVHSALSTLHCPLCEVSSSLYINIRCALGNPLSCNSSRGTNCIWYNPLAIPSPAYTALLGYLCSLLFIEIAVQGYTKLLSHSEFVCRGFSLNRRQLKVSDWHRGAKSERETEILIKTYHR